MSITVHRELLRQVEELDAEKILEIHVEAFREEAERHPKGCCVGQTWKIRITGGKVFIVTTVGVRTAVDSAEWTSYDVITEVN